MAHNYFPEKSAIKEIPRQPSAFAANPDFTGLKPKMAPIGRTPHCPPGFECLGVQPRSAPSAFEYFHTQQAEITARMKETTASYHMQLEAMAPFIPTKMLDEYKQDPFTDEIEKNMLGHLIARTEEMTLQEEEEEEKETTKTDEEEPAKPPNPIPLIFNKWGNKYGYGAGNEYEPVPGTTGPFSREDHEIQAVMARSGFGSEMWLQDLCDRTNGLWKDWHWDRGGGDPWAPIRTPN